MPEKYGLQAYYSELGLLPGAGSGVWVCPNAPDWMREVGCTYILHTARDHLINPDPEREKIRWFVYDNSLLYPAPSGWSGMFVNGYQIPSGERQDPHGSNSFTGGKGYNMLFQDGHVQYKSVDEPEDPNNPDSLL